MDKRHLATVLWVVASTGRSAFQRLFQRRANTTIDLGENMQTKNDQGFKMPGWLLIYPALLTLWSIGFAIWFVIDGAGAFETFGIPTQAEPFIWGLFNKRVIRGQVEKIV